MICAAFKWTVIKWEKSSVHFLQPAPVSNSICAATKFPPGAETTEQTTIDVTTVKLFFSLSLSHFIKQQASLSLPHFLLYFSHPPSEFSNSRKDFLSKAIRVDNVLSHRPTQPRYLHSWLYYWLESNLLIIDFYLAKSISIPHTVFSLWLLYFPPFLPPTK